MDSEQPRAPDVEEALPDPPDDDVLHRLISDEMGDKVAEVMRLTRRAQEAWHRSRHPDEGLRERKRRLTRQLISDAATTMFATRGFDNVRVAEVADRVGVSEKTIYNYFPTKESMVLDTADETVEALAQALRDRRPEESLTETVVAAIKADTERYDQAPDALVEFMPAFVSMIEGTPALRAAWLELHDRLAKVARDELAAQAGVDPRDPEPTAAGRALAGLAEVALQSRVRHIREGLRGAALSDAVNGDPGARRPVAGDGPVVVQPPGPGGACQAPGTRRRRGRGADPRAGGQGDGAGPSGLQAGGPPGPRGRQAGQGRRAGPARSQAAQTGGALNGVPSVAVLGPGGVGGFVAAALARARVNVVVVAREPAATALSLTGMTVRSAALGNFVAHPGVVAGLNEPVDVLLVATKATGLEAALDQIHAQPRLVVPLLNGVEHLAVLRQRFGRERVVAGVIRIESDRPRPGEIVQTSPGAGSTSPALVRRSWSWPRPWRAPASPPGRGLGGQRDVVQADAPVRAGSDHQRRGPPARVRALGPAVALRAGQRRGRDRARRRGRGRHAAAGGDDRRAGVGPRRAGLLDAARHRRRPRAGAGRDRRRGPAGRRPPRDPLPDDQLADRAGGSARRGARATPAYATLTPALAYAAR